MTTLAIYSGVAIDSSGNAVASADVEVRLESSGALAAIWSDEAGTIAIANPATALTDANGRFSFYAAGANRGFSVKVTKSADTYTLHNQAIGSAAQLDQSAFTLNVFTAKGSLVAASAAATAAERTVGTDGQVLTADSSQTSGLVWNDPLRSNLLINPNWQIDQINEGALVTVNTTDVRGPDGWSGDAVGAGVFKLRTLADPDNAALKCLEISCTTADASIAATDRYEVWTAIEGYDAAALQLGIASALPFLYQFKLKSNSVTGVFGVYFANSAGNRFYAGTITVSDTSEHEYSVKLSAGDLTGTWLYTNGIGLRMGLVLSAGSNFQGTAGAWTASTVKTASSQANFMSVNTNIIYLKRGQLIPGTVVQPYRNADFQKELAKAQRYYAKSFAQGTAVAQNVGVNTGAVQTFAALGGAASLEWQWRFPISMRTTPTCTGYSPAAASAEAYNETSLLANSATSVNNSKTREATLIQTTQNAGSGAGSRHALHITADARLS